MSESESSSPVKKIQGRSTTFLGYPETYCNFGISNDGNPFQGQMALVLIPLGLDIKDAISPLCQTMVLGSTTPMQTLALASMVQMMPNIPNPSPGNDKNINSKINEVSPLPPSCIATATTDISSETFTHDEESEGNNASGDFNDRQPCPSSPLLFSSNASSPSTSVPGSPSLLSSPAPVINNNYWKYKSKAKFNCTADILKDFDKVPTKPSNYDGFGKLPRKKEERAKLTGIVCDLCEGYFGAIANQLHPDELQRIKNKACRHRTARPVPIDLDETPSWSTDMPGPEGIIIGVASPPVRRKRHDLLD